MELECPTHIKEPCVDEEYENFIYLNGGAPE
jgi:hypothetical protein